MEPNVQPSTTQPAAGAIMSRRLVSVTMDDTLATVQQLFKEHRFHHLLVVETARSSASFPIATC